MQPRISLNVAPTSGIPIYRQLMDQIRAQIAGGRLAAGEFLPSVRQVAEELGIPEGTAKSRMRLGLARIAQALEAQGVDLAWT